MNKGCHQANKQSELLSGIQSDTFVIKIEISVTTVSLS